MCLKESLMWRFLYTVDKKELMHSLLKYVYYCKGILSKDKIALELKEKEGKEDEKLVPSSGDKPRIKV